MRFRGLKKAGDSEESAYDSASISSTTDTAALADAGAEVQLFAGTAWLFAHEALDGKVDTLVIDEAGQVSLADALAMGTAARNVVLLGDPLQLAQVSQGTHPQGTGSSVLEHLLGDNATIPPNMGLFLERTRRMHPDVCRFISEIVYDNRLTGVPELERQTTEFGTGLRFLPVDHSGNAAASSEEAAAIVSEIGKMVGSSWTNRDGEIKPLQQATSWSSRPTTRRCDGFATHCARPTLVTSSRNRRQVPGTRSSGAVLLDGDVERRGRSAQPRVPFLAQPLECSDLARHVPRVRRGEPEAAAASGLPRLTRGTWRGRSPR